MAKKKKRKNSILPVLLGLLFISLGVAAFVFLASGIKNRKETKEPERKETETEEPVVTETLSVPETEDAAEPLPETEEPLTAELEEIVPQEPVVLMFTGDVLLWDGTLARYQDGGIGGLLSEEALATLRSADVLMINEEFPFSTRGEQADKQFTFRCDPAYVGALQEMGADLVTLANNHTLDFGREALADTVDTLDAAGLPYVGAGRDLNDAKRLVTFEINGKTFGFLGASRVWPDGNWSADWERSGIFGTYDPAMLCEEIRKAKESVDYLTVYVHWGIERDTMPQDYQVSMAKQYADAGADLVIGSHPHVLQGMSYAGTVPVCYSLGNFIFNVRGYDTAIIKVTVPPEGTAEVAVIPAHSEGGKVSLLTGEEGTALLRYLDGLSFGGAVLGEDGILRLEQ